MARRKRRTFTDEFKADAVKLVKAGHRTIAQIAKDLDLGETALREWVRRADIDAGQGPRTPSRRLSARSSSGCGARTSGCSWSATS